MADLPSLQLEYAIGGTPVVIVEEQSTSTAEELLRLAPALADPKWVTVYAQVVNHLAQGSSHSVIVAPEEFKAEYMAAYDAEDPDEEVPPGTVRLHNYGLPDFEAIKPPAMEGEVLVFYARNAFLGLPYRATMEKGAEPVYTPAAMAD